MATPSRTSSTALTALLGVLLLLVVLLLVSRCGTDESTAQPPRSSVRTTVTATISRSDPTPMSSAPQVGPTGSFGPVTTTATATEIIVPATTTAVVVPPVTATTVVVVPSVVVPTVTVTRTTIVPRPVTPSSYLIVDAAPLLPLTGPNQNLTPHIGQQVVAAGAPVQAVDAPNGFWVGTSCKNRVWVQLLESGPVFPHPVQVGDHVSFVGRMVANPPGFAASADVTPAEGAAQLTAQGAHIETRKSSLEFV